MKTLFHSATFSNRNGKSFAPSSITVTRKKNRFRKEMNNSAVRRKTRFSPGLLVDYTLFSYILAVDAGLTAEGFLRNRLSGGKRTLPSA
ncbi:hypothetical protein [Candidatus Electrothrix sp.]|uniref:hypothetical protein n=1 Tax=Candidatus Electrothrix sp. TaxID=2170559 RepID=UPI00405794C0